MELIPAIDVLGGKVVRLARGDYDRVTDYGDDPVAVALGWQAQGATRLHLVDLEAARDGTRSQATDHRAHRGRGGHPVPGRWWHPGRRRRGRPARIREWTGSSWARPSSGTPTWARSLVARWGAGAASWPRWMSATAAPSATAGRQARGTPALDLIIAPRVGGRGHCSR